MNDMWMNRHQWKDRVVGNTPARFAEQVRTMDEEIMLAHLHMARKMVDGGSYAALGRWMKSDDEDAVFFRTWVERSGHREIIAHLYKKLRSRDIEELKSVLYER